MAGFGCSAEDSRCSALIPYLASQCRESLLRDLPLLSHNDCSVMSIVMSRLILNLRRLSSLEGSVDDNKDISSQPHSQTGIGLPPDSWLSTVISRPPIARMHAQESRSPSRQNQTTTLLRSDHAPLYSNQNNIDVEGMGEIEVTSPSACESHCLRSS